jgi:hypothetical protein
MLAGEGQDFCYAGFVEGRCPSSPGMFEQTPGVVGQEFAERQGREKVVAGRVL